MSEAIVGIDLGTTNSAIGVLDENGQPRIIQIDGKSTMPSCVGIDDEGNLLVGQPAVNQFIANPENTVRSIKRKMGMDARIPLGGKEFSPEEISSFILRELKKHAEADLGQEVKKAVITVPAYFDERQRKATQNAGTLAGLEVLRIINEPTAAALAYDAGKDNDECILVYDFGGGTFDVSVVRVEDGVVEVKSSKGDTELGGDDLDQALIDYVIEHFKEKYEIDPSDNLKAMNRLKMVMEQHKWSLSEETYVNVQEEFLHEDRHLTLEISRLDYEDKIRHYIDKTLECVSESLNSAEITPQDINRIMLVGGSTRTPLVQELLEDKLGIRPHFEINPDLIVAMGAAIQAGNLAGQKASSILVDITAHSYSVDCLSFEDGVVPMLRCSHLIRSNTPIPSHRSEIFYTSVENQKTLKLNVYQGESRDPDENTKIGNLNVEDLGPAPVNDPIVIDFRLDLNGTLQVTAMQKKTGQKNSVILDTRGYGSQLDIEAAKQNIQGLVGMEETQDIDVEVIEPEEAGGLPSLHSAKDLRKRAEAILKKGELDEEDSAEIQEHLDAMAKAVREHEEPTLKKHCEELSDVLFYLED